MNSETLLLLIGIVAFGGFALAFAYFSTGIYNFLSGLAALGALGAAGYVLVRALMGA